MSIPAPGQGLLPFTLRDLTSTDRSLHEFLRPAGTLLAFGKAECPACRLALPFVENLHSAYTGDAVAAVVVTQNTIGEARAFAAELGLTLPLLCEKPPYSVSASYGVLSTPTFFLLDADGVVRESQPGFLKAFFLDLRDRWRDATGRPAVDPFGGADVPSLVPG